MDVSKYIAGWRERARQEAEATAVACARARAALPKVVEVLRRHGARRLWLIGSLSRGTFEKDSDIDLLAEGLGEHEAERAAIEASDVAGLHVDIIRAESLDEGWREYHLRYGEKLYG